MIATVETPHAARYTAWVLDHPLLALLICGCCVLIGMSGLPRLSMTADYRSFFGPDNPELEAFEAFEHEYELAETLVFGLRARDGTSVFTPDRLDAIRQLTEQGWQLPWAQRSSSLANYQHTRAIGDDILVEPLIPDGALTPADARRIQTIALGADALVNRLISPDGRVAGAFVTTQLPHSDPTNEVPRVAEAARALVSDIETAHPDLQVHVTGVTMLNDTLAQVMRRDIAVLTPACLLIIAAGLWFYFRHVPAVVVTLGVVGASVLSALGVASWLGIVLTDASAASMLCIMTLAVADCVHVLTTYIAARGERQHQRDALVEAMRLNLQPVLVTSVTTIIGFLTLNASDSPPFRDLGNIVAIGVVYAALLSVLGLPAAISLLPDKPSGQPPTGMRQIEQLGDWVVRRRRWAFVGSASVLLLLISGLTQNRFGDNYIEYFPDEHPFSVATRFVNDELSGMQAVEFSVPSGEPGGVLDPTYLRELARFERWLNSLPDTRKVISLVSLMQRLNQTMRGDDPAWDRIPESRELAAQYLLFYELSLPQGLSLNNLLAADRSRSRVTVLLDAIDSGQVQAINADIEAWIRDELPPHMQTDGVGTTLMFAEISKRNFEAMTIGVLAAVVLIGLVLAWVFRSPRLGLMSLIPNLLPALAAYGAWGYLVGRLDLSLSVVGSLALGILVDDTVHFLSKYQRARQESGLTPEDAVRYAFRLVGSALLATSAVLVAGFLLFSLSHFSMVENLGQLTALSIALALFCDFLFLPPLLIWLDGRRKRSATSVR